MLLFAKVCVGAVCVASAGLAFFPLRELLSDGYQDSPDWIFGLWAGLCLAAASASGLGLRALRRRDRN